MRFFKTALGVSAAMALSATANAELKVATVDVQKLHGKSRNCCFKGMTLTGQVLYTFLGGELVFSRG